MSPRGAGLPLPPETVTTELRGGAPEVPRAGSTVMVVKATGEPLVVAATVLLGKMGVVGSVIGTMLLLPPGPETVVVVVHRTWEVRAPDIVEVSVKVTTSVDGIWVKVEGRGPRSDEVAVTVVVDVEPDEDDRTEVTVSVMVATVSATDVDSAVSDVVSAEVDVEDSYTVLGVAVTVIVEIEVVSDEEDASAVSVTVTTGTDKDFSLVAVDSGSAENTEPMLVLRDCTVTVVVGITVDTTVKVDHATTVSVTLVVKHAADGAAVEAADTPSAVTELV